MVLSRLTKITGPGVATDTNWVGNNADFTGITTTATSFNIGVTTIHSNLIEAHNIKSTGIITATGGSFSGNVTAVDGTFSGNVSIAGTLTYEDVTNIDAVGIITAPALDVDDFLDVGSNIKLGNAGVITATSFVGSGAALTGIDATAIKDSGGNVKIQAQASGAIHSGVSTFQDIDVDGHTNLDNLNIAGVSTFAGTVNTASIVATGIDLNGDIDVDGHTNLDNVNIAGVVTATSFVGSGANLTSLPIGGSNAISLNDNVNLNIGTGNDGSLFNTGSYLFLKNHNGNVAIQASGTGSVISLQKYNNSDIGLQYVVDGSIKAYYNNSLKFTTETSGVNITGVCTATSFSGDGSALTGITQTTINNNANNRVITGSGTANTLEGEANFTYDGTYLNYTANVNQTYPSSTNTNYMLALANNNGIRMLVRGDGLYLGEPLTNSNSGSTPTGNKIRIKTNGDIQISGNFNCLADNKGLYLGGSNQLEILGLDNGDSVINAASGNLKIQDSGSSICILRSDGFEMYEGIYPSADGGEDLGKSNRRWNNIYTNDLHLSNEGKSNVVDGTWGDWTLQEGESDVYMINNRSGKKFKIRMEEVS